MGMGMGVGMGMWWARGVGWVGGACKEARILSCGVGPGHCWALRYNVASLAGDQGREGGTPRRIALPASTDGQNGHGWVGQNHGGLHSIRE